MYMYIDIVSFLSSLDLYTFLYVAVWYVGESLSAMDLHGVLVLLMKRKKHFKLYCVHC